MLQKIAFLLLITFSQLAFASPEQKIAVVDVQAILENSTAVSGIRNAVEKISLSLQTEFSKKETELKEIEKKLLESRSSLTEDQFEKEVGEFNKKVTETQKILQEKKINLDQAHGKAMSKINEVALKIISDLALENNYAVVLPSTQVLYASEKLNITEQVLNRLNAKLPSITLRF